MTLKEINKRIKEEKQNLNQIPEGLPYSDICKTQINSLKRERLELIKGWFK